ncbi:MAG: hypothetical protein AAGA61_04795 [Pseudomonadota bacterium]
MSGTTRSGIEIAAPFCVTMVCLLSLCAHAQDPADPNYLDRKLDEAPPDAHMPEALRGDIRKVIVISGDRVAGESVDGTYERTAPGLAGGMARGSDMATISKEIGGVPINLPIPGLQLPASIIGGIAGVTMKQIQEFRDALTEEIVNSDSPPLRSDGLAIDAFWGIRRLSHIDSQLFSPSLEIPQDTDAIVYTDFADLSIEVDGRDAVITTTATANVFSQNDSRDVYRTEVHYQDRDRLVNWTANDNAVWKSYTNFARHYLGRALAADLFGRIDLEHELIPVESNDAEFARKSRQMLETDELTPTLAWQLTLGEASSAYGRFGEAIDLAAVTYDLEVFDNRQLVYDANGIAGTRYRLSYELEPCQTYRWSVRPVYTVDGSTRFGKWMRFDYDPEADPSARSKKKSKKKSEATSTAVQAVDKYKGLRGRQASTAPAYIQDFAGLTIGCRR